MTSANANQRVHFAAFGFEPLRMKPVHFASGFFLSITGYHYELRLLNQAAVARHKDGLKDDYTADGLGSALIADGRASRNLSADAFKLLKFQVNGVVDNDNAVFATFSPYKMSFGNDYTMVSDKFLTNHKRLDGYSGYFLHQVLAQTTPGRDVIKYARTWITEHNSPLEHMVSPLLDADSSREDWENPYSARFGDLDKSRLRATATLMADQTVALRTLCANLEKQCSHHSRLRYLVMGLCSWLFLYTQKYSQANHRSPILVMDFLGAALGQMRMQSRYSFARQRELVFNSYEELRRRKQLDCSEDDVESIRQTKYKFLEQHFSDLAIRIGFAQPRAAQARRKHFELQPDTARMLLMSIVAPKGMETLQEASIKLRETWGVCFGGCDDDHVQLSNAGYTGLDTDDHLQPNAGAFVQLMKRLNLAVEPSDGLVLIAADPEVLL